jgi:O-antigen/teichoic acid export membrane protein
MNPNDASATQTLHNNIYYLFALGAIVAGAAVLFGGNLLALMFGDGFRAAGHTFAVLCIGTLWYLIGFPLGYSLIARAQNRRFLAGAAVAGILSVSLDVALIPPYGMMGAAIANAICFAGGATVWIVGYGRLDRSLAIVVAGLCACTSAVAVAVATPSLRTALGVAVGLAGAAAAIFAVRTSLRSSGWAASVGS